MYPLFFSHGNAFGNGSCARGNGIFTTLPTYFREHCYATTGGGKVFHPQTCDGLEACEAKYAWSQPYLHAPCPDWGSLPCRSKHFTRGCGIDSWVSNTTTTDDDAPDGMIAMNAVQQIKRLSAKSDQPWFIAAGFRDADIEPLGDANMEPLSDTQGVLPVRRAPHAGGARGTCRIPASPSALHRHRRRPYIGIAELHCYRTRTAMPVLGSNRCS